MDRYTELYNTIQSLLASSNKKLEVSNITEITIELMQLVESYDELSGADRKELVMDVFRQLIRDNVSQPELQNIMTEIANFMMPSVIDAIIAFDKGDLKINIPRAISKCGGFFKCCKKSATAP